MFDLDYLNSIYFSYSMEYEIRKARLNNIKIFHGVGGFVLSR